MKLAGLTRLRWLLGTLLIAAAVLFAFGVASEGDTHSLSASTVESGEHDEAIEQAEQRQQSEAAESSSETVFGVNVESTPLIVLGVTMSVALAAATWRRDHKRVLLVTAVFATVFAALDLVEFFHQITKSAATVAIFAAGIAILHVAAALVAEQRRAAT